MRNKLIWALFLDPLGALLIIGAGLLLIPVCQGADEISVTATLKVKNGSYDQTRSVSNYKVDQATQASDAGIVASATTATNSLPIVNVTTPRYMYVRNLDSSTSNSIFVNLVIKLDAGDVGVFPVSTTNITHYSTNGPANLEYWINAQ